jgi:hypothetical protein
VNRILQITSCVEPGWRVVFEMEDGAIETEPVACWLLVEADGEQHVHPAAALGSDIADAACVANYLGVVSPGTDPEMLLQAIATSSE